MFIWFLGAIIGCIEVLTHLDKFSISTLMPFGLLIFGVALVLGGFWFEASKQKLRFIELLSEN